MSTRTPAALGRFCRQTVPQLIAATDGRRMLEAAADVVDTDRWNSFDRFHDTTRVLCDRYERSGARVEVEAVQTGGRIGSGRWIIQEAQDIRSVTVDVVAPVRQRIIDYRDNPWHAVQWTAATPKEGLRNEFVVIDDADELERLRADALMDKTVLTRLDIRTNMRLFADRGASVVITDRGQGNLPNATPWTKFGWGRRADESRDGKAGWAGAVAQPGQAAAPAGQTPRQADAAHQGGGEEIRRYA